MPQPTAGPIVLFSDIEVAVRDTLQAWVPFYLAEIDEQADPPRPRGTTGAPRAYDVAHEDSQRWLEATPPSLLVVCRGTVDAPQRHGKDAAYGAWWQVNIAVTAGGATEAGTRDLAGRHAGAIYAVITQQPDMGGLCEDARWMGAQADPADRNPDVLVAEIEAHVYVPHVIATRGPLIPRASDLPDLQALPTVTGSQVTTAPTTGT